ncbi:MAG: hypothetical protein M1825_006484 [Sarcosagium campestre]|nr:MAG: hypothetical protein M1825_006484 [Sarcosagium campestre]
MESNRIPIWLDCDPGHDDAFAILLAAHHPSLHLLGISTVHGNAPLAQTTDNALRILSAIGRNDIPVYPGVSRPFCRPAVHAPDIHGSTGIDGTDLLPAASTDPQASDLEPFLIAARKALLSTPKGSAWVVSTGALTNTSLLLTSFPDISEWIGGLSIMGGAFGEGFTDADLGKAAGEVGDERKGNITKWAEFNIYCDPEAAQALLTNSTLIPKTTLIPLDLTHKVLVTSDVRERLFRVADGAREPTLLRRMLHDLVAYFASTYSHVFGVTTGPPLHDPVAVAALLPTHVVPFDDGSGERWLVEVTTTGRHGEEGSKAGMTTATRLELGERGIRIPRALDVEAFWAQIEQCVARAES